MYSLTSRLTHQRHDLDAHAEAGHRAQALLDELLPDRARVIALRRSEPQRRHLVRLQLRFPDDVLRRQDGALS